MKCIRPCIILACCLVTAAHAGGLEERSISATQTAKFPPEEKRVAALAFIAAVHNKRVTRMDTPTVQKDADKLAHGIRAHLEDELERSGRVK